VTWDLFMYGAGVGCLLSIAVISTVVLFESLYHNRAKIMIALRGNDRPGFVPLSPTASVLPLRTSAPKLRAVEADAQPTHSKLVA
jgi:hypothetical protein